MVNKVRLANVRKNILGRGDLKRKKSLGASIHAKALRNRKEAQKFAEVVSLGDRSPAEVARGPTKCKSCRAPCRRGPIQPRQGLSSAHSTCLRIKL